MLVNKKTWEVSCFCSLPISPWERRVLSVVGWWGLWPKLEDALQEATCVESPWRSHFHGACIVLCLWNDWYLWWFFPLNVLLDFSLLGCGTVSAHSHRRGCCLGLLVEQFLSCFLKSHHKEVGEWDWVRIHIDCLATWEKLLLFWVCLFPLTVIIWEQSQWTE